MQLRFRLRSMGPKYEVASGVGVFESRRSSGSAIVASPLAGDGRPRQWSLAHRADLTYDLASLEFLDAHLDEWNSDPSHHEILKLADGVGIYLSNVILRNVAKGRWRVWPNGHPVVGLRSGREIEVNPLINDRLVR
jgi:hypothetical protein